MGSAESFLLSLEELLRTIVPPAPATLMEAEAALARQEATLGHPLPSVLRQFYLRVSTLREVMSSHHRFADIEDLRIDRDALVFCRENQDLLCWGVLRAELELDDPRVFQRQSGKAEWVEECGSLAIFLVNFTAWQLVNAAPAAGQTRIGRTTIKLLKQYMKVVSATLKFNMACFVEQESGTIACLLYDTEMLFVGARSQTSLDAFSLRTGIDLDWL